MDFNTIFTEDTNGIKLTSDKPLTIQIGQSSLTLAPSGKITLKGTSISIDGQVSTKVTAQGIITIKGGMIELN